LNKYKEAQMANPLSRREVLKFGAYTTVGGVLTPGISLAQAIVTDTKGIVDRDIQLSVGGTMIPAYDAHPEAPGRYPVVVVISGFTGNRPPQGRGPALRARRLLRDRARALPP